MGSPVIFNGSRAKLLTSSGLLLSNGTTVDFDGAINYIANSGFEINSTGYSAYANAAGTSPVSGTGGAPTVTIARSTSSPLIQTASGLFTHGASNQQGQGFSYAFTLDSGVSAQALPCTIAGYYKVASGTFASGDLTVWIVDVTNSTVITPTGNSLLNSANPQNFQCTFTPATNSTSYRLCFHVSTTTATAYTMQFDNIRVSPNTYGNSGTAAGVYLQYTNAAGTSLTANTTLIPFATKVTDSHNAWSGTIFTAPLPGWYDVKGSINAGASSENVLMLVNGSFTFAISTNNNASQKTFAGGTYLTAAQTLSFQVDQNTTMGSTAAYSWIAITSQG